MKITKKTYAKNVTKFANSIGYTWNNLSTWMKKQKLSSKKVDELCRIIDSYIMLNIDIREYCHKNDIDVCEFTEDVENASNKYLKD